MPCLSNSPASSPPSSTNPPPPSSRLTLTGPYILGALVKLTDWHGAVAEQIHFGLQPAALFAAITIAVGVVGSALVLANRLAWLGTGMLGVFTFFAALVANAFWTMQGTERFAATNAFFEHLGLVGGFVLVTIVAQLRRPPPRFVGSQMDASLSWRTTPELELSGSVSAFEPDAFIRQTGPSRTITMLGLESNFRF